MAPLHEAFLILKILSYLPRDLAHLFPQGVNLSPALFTLFEKVCFRSSRGRRGAGRAAGYVLRGGSEARHYLWLGVGFREIECAPYPIVPKNNSNVLAAGCV